MFGTAETRLIILRGNSASGKSSIARKIRELLPDQKVAIVSQDVIRREILKEHPEPGAPNIGLIDIVTRYALDHGYHVVLEGIFHAPTHNELLRRLAGEHMGHTRAYYLDVPLEETLQRHLTKPVANEYGEAELRRWFHPDDRLEFPVETVIPASSPLGESVRKILEDCGLYTSQ